MARSENTTGIGPYDEQAHRLAGLIRESERDLSRRLDEVDYSKLTAEQADAIAAKLDEAAALAADYDGDSLDDTTHSEKIDKVLERLKDPDDILNLVDGLRNRIRWVDGTAAVIASAPHIDETIANAYSSVEEHLREAGELVRKLEMFGASLRRGGAA